VAIFEELCRRHSETATGYAGHWSAASPNDEPQRSQPRCDLPSGAPAGPNGPVGFRRHGRTRHHDRGRTIRPPALSLPASGYRSRDSSMPMSCSVAKASWPWRKAAECAGTNGERSFQTRPWRSPRSIAWSTMRAIDVAPRSTAVPAGRPCMRVLSGVILQIVADRMPLLIFKRCIAKHHPASLPVPAPFVLAGVTSFIRPYWSGSSSGSSSTGIFIK
jgi:hypothetical protein